MSRPISEFVKPNPLPKYFAIDVDGTFYTTKEDVYKRNIEAFKLLKDKNIIPFFCTARDRISNRILLGDLFTNELGYQDFPGIYNNGCLVYDSNGNIVKSKMLPDHFVEKFYRYIIEYGLETKVIFSTEDSLYCIKQLQDEVLEFFINDKNDTPKIIPYHELIKKNVLSIVIISHNVDNFEFNNEVSYFTYHKGYFGQFVIKGWNKKLGLEEFLKHVYSNSNECAYIGDGVNDRDSLEYCTTSFAVGDADDVTKQKAKWVIDINHDEGAFEKAVKLLCE